MNISDIDLNYKEIIECNEEVWPDSWCTSWCSSSFKFKLLSRKENAFLFEVWKRECIPDYDEFGSPFRLGNWELKGTSVVYVPIKIIENEINYKNLLRNEIAPRLRHAYRS